MNTVKPEFHKNCYASISFTARLPKKLSQFIIALCSALDTRHRLTAGGLWPEWQRREITMIFFALVGDQK